MLGVYVLGVFTGIFILLTVLFVKRVFCWTTKAVLDYRFNKVLNGYYCKEDDSKKNYPRVEDV